MQNHSQLLRAHLIYLPRPHPGGHAFSHPQNQTNKRLTFGRGDQFPFIVLRLQVFPETHRPDTLQTNPFCGRSLSPGSTCQEVQDNATGHCHMSQFSSAQVPVECQDSRQGQSLIRSSMTRGCRRVCVKSTCCLGPLVSENNRRTFSLTKFDELSVFHCKKLDYTSRCVRVIFAQGPSAALTVGSGSWPGMSQPEFERLATTTVRAVSSGSPGLSDHVVLIH